jgi:hypothetical protein
MLGEAEVDEWEGRRFCANAVSEKNDQRFASDPIVGPVDRLHARTYPCSAVARMAVTVGVTLLLAGTARAQERGTPDANARLDDYCERVREAAKSTAALLLGPRIAAQAIKFPPGGDAQLTGWTNGGSKTQLRAYADYSLTNAYQGILSFQLGEADCRRRKLAQPLEDAIRLSTDQGRRSALTKEVEFLEVNEKSVVQIQQESLARRQAGAGTLDELAEIESLAATYHGLRLQVEQELAHLDVLGSPDPNGPVSPRADEYNRAAMELERVESRIRKVAPWGLSITGGVAASSGALVDWFGTVEVSYNLGGIAQSQAEHEVLKARGRELEADSHELARAARALDAALKQSLDLLQRQIVAVEAEERQLRAELAALEGSSLPNLIHQRAGISIRLLTLEANLVYLRALAQQRRPWEQAP